MLNLERKRTYSTAFNRPATSTEHDIKAEEALTPSALAQDEPINDENKAPADQAKDHITDDIATPSQPRAGPLQELVKIPSSDGKFRAKLTLGDDSPVEVEQQWEAAPFAIWEDVDVVAEKLALDGEEE